MKNNYTEHKSKRRRCQQHHILDNRGLIMLVRPDKVRLLNMNIFLGWTDSYWNIQQNSAPAFHDEFTPVCIVTGQRRMAKRANAF